MTGLSDKSEAELLRAAYGLPVLNKSYTPMDGYVTHVDGWLLWKGGYSRKMTWRERVLWRLRKLDVVRP